MASIVIAGDTSGSVSLAAPAVAGSNVLTLPAVTDTVAGIAATQTLTNKTLTAPTLTTPTLGVATATNLKATQGLSVGNATLDSNNTGLTFPSTAVLPNGSNTLYDYELGTWTPQLKGETVSGTGITYGTVPAIRGAYCKVGNLVNIVFTVTLSNKGTMGGNIVLTNLPFAATNPSYIRYGTGSLVWGNLNTNWSYLTLQVDDGGYFYISGTKTAAANTAQLVDTDLTNTTYFAGSITYITVTT